MPPSLRGQTSLMLNRLPAKLLLILLMRQSRYTGYQTDRAVPVTITRRGAALIDCVGKCFVVQTSQCRIVIKESWEFRPIVQFRYLTKGSVNNIYPGLLLAA